jgi:hypothetical protein
LETIAAGEEQDILLTQEPEEERLLLKRVQSTKSDIDKLIIENELHLITIKQELSDS